MKKVLSKNNGVVLLKVALSLIAGVALAAGLWFASAPVASAVEKTPAELIQSQLPKDMTIASATDAQLLDAVCKSVKQAPKDAGLIVRTAGGARQSLRGDILCMSLRCVNNRRAGDNSSGLDCNWALSVVREWVKQDANLANQLVESVSQCAPNCRDTFQNLAVGEGNFSNPPSNINAPPGSVGGGAGGDVCVVCHNGSNVQIACSDLQGYLGGHQGDTAGACQSTPIVNP